MAHWAEVDKDNVVLRVIVGNNDDLDEGYKWIIDNLGGTWVKTSYNNNIRKRFAGINYTYDANRDVFIAPQPFPSWTLNEETTEWEPPVPMPQDGNFYVWVEATKEWVIPV